jgi:hypothetical protein
VVPRYYMNLRYRDRLFRDEEGDDLPEHALRQHALSTARDLLQARMDSIRSWFECSFEVTDEEGRLVLTVPFTEAVEVH